MSQNLLNRVLSAQERVATLQRWCLANEANANNEFPCSRGEFISHLLNFIHEEALCFEKFRETPKKVHTPKSIRKLEVNAKPRRRPALFTEPASCTPRNSNFQERSDGCEKNSKGQCCPLSPGSPLCTRLNELPGDNSPVVTPPKSKNFCLGDFITPNRKSTGKERKLSSSTPTSAGCGGSLGDMRKTKRINPTNVAQRRTLHTYNTFDFKKDAADEAKPFVRHDNVFVKEDKGSKIDSEPKFVVNTKSPQREIPPNLDLITQKDQLSTLVTLYVDLINHNRVLNVASELYFIITLLLCKQYDSDYFPSQIFASIHNVVYFAMTSLQKIVEETACNVLNLLDKSALRLLATNERIRSLDAHLAHKFATLCDLSDSTEESAMKYVAAPENNVCFDSDTDNRENFPSDASFHAFRKQRDMFYEILHTWETNHATDGWNFTAALGGKVKTLIGMHAEPANFRHLSKLIKSQLLISCSRVQDEYLPANQLSFLTTLPNMTSEKLNRLKSRLIAKDQSTGINAAPIFPGTQEFYKELIAQAHTHVFCTHIRNVFIQDLLLLNETTFETDSGMFDQATKANYCAVVKSLQLLAKFIGYIDAMPYQSQTNVLQNHKITLEEVEARSWMSPAIDLHQKLTSAMKNGQLILLIPWFVEYLAMLDATTLRLPYFEAVFTQLFTVFVGVRFSNEGNGQLIRCCLGWLFEQQAFPSENYFHFLNVSAEKPELELKPRRGSIDAIDNAQMIDVKMLHALCPYLKEFKKLLQYNCNRNGSITSKHITPVTAIETVSAELSEKRLKMQLQEAFLNSKPSSLRKTLEFVAERIASCIVKTICNQVVPAVKMQASSERKALLASHATDAHTDTAFKLELQEKLTQSIWNNLNQLRNDAEATLSQQIKEKIYPGVRALLCADEIPEGVQVCAQIASRMCEERVKQWINTRVNTSVFKEFDVDLERIDKLLQKERLENNKQKCKSLPTQGRSNVDHIDSDDDTIPETSSPTDPKRRLNSQNSAIIMNPSKLMTQLQCGCAKLLKITQSGVVQPLQCEEDIATVLQHAKRCYKHRSDLSEIAWHQINQLLVDYLILLCTKTPSVVTNTLLDHFLNFWTETSECYLKDIFNGVISVRNTVILMTAVADCSKLAWRCYSQLLTRLLDQKLLASEDFESQCLAVFRENWDSVTLERFCQCLQDVVDQRRSRDRFEFLLGFLADYCSDLDVAF